MIRDMTSRYIAIYLAISHTLDRLEAPGTNNPNSTKTHHLVAVYSCFSAVSALTLAVFVWPFLSFFCCPPAGHIIGLTVSPANSNLVPSGLGLLPERMHACFCFIFHFFSFLFFLSLSFFLLDTWY